MILRRHRLPVTAATSLMARGRLYMAGVGVLIGLLALAACQGEDTVPEEVAALRLEKEALADTVETALHGLAEQEVLVQSLLERVDTPVTELLEHRLASVEGLAGRVVLPMAERVFYVTAFEPSGGTTVDQLAPPPVDPHGEISEGYRFRPTGFDPARPDRWEVAAYVWSPATMVALQGDRITLRIFVTNGDSHETHIFNPLGEMVPFDAWITGAEGTKLDMQMGVTEVEAQRGRETVVTLVADQPGVYVLHCHTHEPSMDAFILVLPALADDVGVHEEEREVREPHH